MGLPKKLKNFNLFINGTSYMGEVTEVTLPKLSRKMEEYLAGGMSGPVEVDLGNEKLEMQWKAGGLLVDVIKQYGVTTHNGVQLRFAGAFQNDDIEGTTAVEVLVSGRHKEIDMGSAKVGDDTEHQYTTNCSYYKLEVDGETLLEIDFVNCVLIVGGEDRMASIRAAIGL